MLFKKNPEFLFLKKKGTVAYFFFFQIMSLYITAPKTIKKYFEITSVVLKNSTPMSALSCAIF